jgi:hypothetical protein
MIYLDYNGTKEYGPNQIVFKYQPYDKRNILENWCLKTIGKEGWYISTDWYNDTTPSSVVPIKWVTIFCFELPEHATLFLLKFRK